MLPGRRIPVVCLVLALIIMLSIPALTVASKDHSATAEKSYRAAKDYFLQLKHEGPGSAQRSAWLEGVRKFRRIYLEKPTGSLAPSCLFMMGRMQHEMYTLFEHEEDIDDAVAYFTDVANIFAANSLADDSLFKTAEIMANEKGDRQQAAEQYLKIITFYPKGDRYSLAMARLNRLKQSGKVRLPASALYKLQGKTPVRVLPVRYWSSEDYTRVVISASAPVHFYSDLLESSSDQPRRLYIDFKESYIPPKYRSPVPIKDGLLQQVRTAQYNDSTVRVVLDMASISTYKVFSLNDPFRVVVDVHGKPGEALPFGKETTITAKRYKSPVAGNTQPGTPAGRTAKAAWETTGGPFITLSDSKKRPVAGTAPGDKGLLGSPNYSLAQQLGLGVRRIVLDPGHGGKDPGATANGLQEKEIVLAISQKTAHLLESTYGYEVSLTRSGDYYLPLEERTAIANTRKADLFVSIHINAHPDRSARGIETYYLNLATNAEAMRVAALENATSTHNISEMQDILATLMQNSKINESSRLAKAVHSKLITGLSPAYRIRDLGVKQAPFYVLLGAQMPSILAEIAFITNPAEARLLEKETFLNAVAAKLAAGVVSYVNQNTTAALIQD